MKTSVFEDRRLKRQREKSAKLNSGQCRRKANQERQVARDRTCVTKAFADRKVNSCNFCRPEADLAFRYFESKLSTASAQGTKPCTFLRVPVTLAMTDIRW